MRNAHAQEASLMGFESPVSPLLGSGDPLGQCNPNEDVNSITGLARMYPVVDTQEQRRGEEECDLRWRSSYMKNQKTPIIKGV